MLNSIVGANSEEKGTGEGMMLRRTHLVVRMVSVIKPKQVCTLDQPGSKASADLARTKAVAHDRGSSHALDRLYAATVLTKRRASSVQHLAIGSVEEE